MVDAITRRALFGRLRGGPEQLRPPWSRPESEFVERCTQCGKCAEACPAGLIGRGHAGYPIVDFRAAACTFCGACAAACGTGCFEVLPGAAPWHLTARISTECLERRGVSCRVCQDACEVGAIRFRPRLGGGASAEIARDQCTGCGACVAPCPASAISVAIPSQPETTS